MPQCAYPIILRKETVFYDRPSILQQRADAPEILSFSAHHTYLGGHCALCAGCAAASLQPQCIFAHLRRSRSAAHHCSRRRPELHEMVRCAGAVRNMGTEHPRLDWGSCDHSQVSANISVRLNRHRPDHRLRHCCRPELDIFHEAAAAVLSPAEKCAAHADQRGVHRSPGQPPAESPAPAAPAYTQRPRFCKNCGSSLSEGCTYCTNCGTYVEKAPQTYL